MNGLPVRSLAATLLIAGAAACSMNSSLPEGGVTKSESLVSGCQKVGEVSAGDNTAPADVNTTLSNEARSKGANYVLISSDGARQGTAYRCEAPKIASH